MPLISRRAVLAAAGTLTVASAPRKPRAAEDDLGDLASALQRIDPPTPPPDISFVTADGTEHHLSEFAGHGMVVNLWATWCAPCIAELPALEVLSKTLAPEDIAVLPLSSDRGGADTVSRYFQAHGITGLPVLLDPKSAAAHAWHARGIPTTVIIDRHGMQRARMEGSADWSTGAAAAVIRKLVA
jgi:thiol-disulfide isomerase/thioredoxin